MLERYNPILAAIKSLCPTAHIGGGAVRDTLLERPIKDIDLFLDDAVLETAAKLLRSEFCFVKVSSWTQHEGFSDPVVEHLAKFEKWDEVIPISLIGLARSEEGSRDMVANLRRFDFGVCQAGWNGEEICTTDEYKRDVERKSFTLLRADNAAQYTYSMARFDKMTKDRYAGWDLVVPPRFGALKRDYDFKKTYYFDDMDGELKYREGFFEQQSHPKAR